MSIPEFHPAHYFKGQALDARNESGKNRFHLGIDGACIPVAGLQGIFTLPELECILEAVRTGNPVPFNNK